MSASKWTRMRRSVTRAACALGAGAALGYLLDPASGLARRVAIRERVLGLIPGSIRGKGHEEIAPGPPVGGQDAQHEGQGDPTGGAAFVQLVERR